MPSKAGVGLVGSATVVTYVASFEHLYAYRWLESQSRTQTRIDRGLSRPLSNGRGRITQMSTDPRSKVGGRYGSR